MNEKWRDIPGYDGAYQISDLGHVRSYRHGRWGRSNKATPLTPYIRKRGNGTSGHGQFVKLTAADGKSKEVKVLTLMVETWLGGSKPGLVPYHKNGNLSDHAAWNIGFATTKELGQKTGAQSRRQPVVKIAADMEIVATYPSAREAGRQNYMSYQTIMDRCNGKIKKTTPAPDGFEYAWDDDRSINATMNRIRAQAEKAGRPINDPKTPRYYDIEPEGATVSAAGAQWFEI